MKQYIMLKCLNCGHLFKSNVNTKATRCHKCGKSSFLQVDKINEAAVADIEILKQDFVKFREFTMEVLQKLLDRIKALEARK